MVALTLALPAHADVDAVTDAAPSSGDPLRPHWELAATGGYMSPPIRGGTSPFGAGFGGRLAYAPSAWTFAGFLGATDTGSANRAWKYGGEVGRGFGFALGGSWLVLRPHVGAGGVTVIHTDTTTSSSGSTTTTTGRSRTRPASVTVDMNTDVITAASSSSATGTSSATSSVSSLFAGDANSTNVTSYYLEPGVALLLTSGTFFVGADASVLVLPSIAYGGSDPMTWVTYGLSGQVGLMF